MIKKVILTIMLNHACIIVFSQFARLEEFNNYKQQLSLVKEDSSRVLMMSYLSLHYGIWNPDSGAVYGQKALILAKQIKFRRGEARALIGLARASDIQNDLPKSLEYAFQALRIAEENHYLQEKAMCYTDHGYNLSQLEGNLKEDSYYQQAELIYGTLGNDHDLDYWKVFQKMQSATSLFYTYPNDSTLSLIQNLLNSTLNSEYWHPAILRILAEAQIKLGKNEAALNNLKQVIDIVKNVKNYYQLAYAYLDLSSVYRKIHEQDSSIYFAELGFADAQHIGMRDAVLSASQLMAEQYESIDLKKALYYSKIHDSVNEIVYGGEKVKSLQKIISQEQQRQRKKEAAQIAYQNRLKQFGLLSGLGIFLLIAFILYRNNRQKQKVNTELQNTLTQLKATQVQLIQSEKLASLGELTAGIAHEIQNPLNFVNNFSEVNKELLTEMNEEIEKENYSEVKAIAKDVIENEEKINHHGKRADAIVKGMLQHSRTTSSTKEPTDINKLTDEYLRLSYRGLRAKDKEFNAEIKTDFDESIGNINIIPQDIGRVLLNLYNNAFYATNEKMKQAAKDLSGFQNVTGLQTYQPTVLVSTKKENGNIFISVRDNGNGIPQKIVDKIFQPFFTTKPTGQGTGLGLSLSYDIIKAHGGELKVETKEGEGSEFIIQLPQ